MEWPEPLRVPPLLRSIPWELAQREIGVLATDLLAMVAMLLVSLVKDPIGGETSMFMGTYAPVGEPAGKDE